jgi:hypothetical protein
MAGMVNTPVSQNNGLVFSTTTNTLSSSPTTPDEDLTMESPTISTTTESSQQDRSTSASSVSEQSTSSLTVKKRGYKRPQATLFSDSARNRDSVMSLGSIAHLQYYFARTGLLDGKGAQMARKDMRLKPGRSVSLDVPGSYQHPPLSPGLSEDGSMPDDEWDRELALLPPTVSTYNQRPAYVPPPPDVTTLRKELTESLENALKSLKETDKAIVDSDTDGFYQIEGLHILDTTTLAIRAARRYYTAHSHSHRLHSIKSERSIRAELHHVLDILKNAASRNFSGGLKQHERIAILNWIVGISELITSEIAIERKEMEERKAWPWRTGDWTGKEREREEAFIRSFLKVPDRLPTWTEPHVAPENGSDSLLVAPTPFLAFFATGFELIQLHNNFVRESPRSFELITQIHEDIAKPYRRADNLRFWLKAAQLRWDIHLQLQVMPIAANLTESTVKAWNQFDEAILNWCKGVREGLDLEWEEGEKKKGRDALGRSTRSAEPSPEPELAPEPTTEIPVVETAPEPTTVIAPTPLVQMLSEPFASEPFVQIMPNNSTESVAGL